MRLGFLGDGRWAHLAFERFVEDELFEIAFVVPRYGSPDRELCRRAEAAWVDVLLIDRINAPQSVDRLAGYECDALVSISFDQILRRQVLDLCPHGAINIHAGKLPFYRGRNVLNWALINDEREFGVTAHYMDEGIDTGDIVLQRTSPISDEDTYATVLERAVELCAETIHDALRMLARDEANPISQASIHPVGFYTGRRVEGDEWIDWSWPSRRVFNFVRAITDPGPRARTTLGGRQVEVVSAAMIPDAPTYVGTPGEIVGRHSREVHVKTGDSTIALTDVRGAEPRELRIGRRMGSPLEHRIRQLEARLTAPEPTRAES